MTQWRIYHMHVEGEEGFYEITYYNKFGNEIRNVHSSIMVTGEEVQRTLIQLKKIESRFTSNWGIPV